jgi:hypothetical protein
MLIELCERPRSFNKQTPAMAAVQSSAVAAVGFGNATTDVGYFFTTLKLCFTASALW